MLNDTQQPAVQMYHCLPIPEGDWRDIFDTQAIRMALLHNGEQSNTGQIEE